MASITVYTKPACMQCKAVKRLLDKYQAEYQFVDITVDDEAKARVSELGFLQVPVVDMGDGTIFAGYRPDMIKKSLEAVAA